MSETSYRFSIDFGMAILFCFFFHNVGKIIAFDRIMELVAWLSMVTFQSFQKLNDHAGYYFFQEEEEEEEDDMNESDDDDDNDGEFILSLILRINAF